MCVFVVAGKKPVRFCRDVRLNADMDTCCDEAIPNKFSNTGPERGNTVHDRERAAKWTISDPAELAAWQEKVERLAMMRAATGCYEEGPLYEPPCSPVYTAGCCTRYDAQDKASYTSRVVPRTLDARTEMI